MCNTYLDVFGDGICRYFQRIHNSFSAIKDNPETVTPRKLKKGINRELYIFLLLVQLTVGFFLYTYGTANYVTSAFDVIKSLDFLIYMVGLFVLAASGKAMQELTTQCDHKPDPCRSEIMLHML